MNEMPLMDRVAVRQVCGDRSRQEDEYALCEIDTGTGDHADHFLLVLSDGMGGHAGGEQASRIVTRTFIEAYQESDAAVESRLRIALDASNRAVADAIASNPPLGGMGCTLVGVAVADGAIHWISVGDSPLWLLHEGRLIRMNADHSMSPVLADLVEAGHLSREEAELDAQRNVLRSAVTGSEINLVDQSMEARTLVPGDRILLASDGIRTLSEEQIESIAGREGVDSAESAADLLIDAIDHLACEGQDNTTVMLFEFDGSGSEEGERLPASPDAVRETSSRQDDA